MAEHLAEPVSGASLGIFRAAFGLIMMLEAWTLCRPSQSVSGANALENYFTGPEVLFTFPYDGFQWLPLLPAPWIRALVGLMAAAAFCVAVGFLHRISAALVFLCWGYLYAIECTRTYWMSYYYLELLASFLLIWLPAARRYSADSWLRARREPAPGPRTVPRWTVWLLRSQLIIAYFYAGVAKLNTDWLLDAQPVRYFLSHPSVKPPFESLLSPRTRELAYQFLHGEGLAYFLCYAGAAFDLVIGALLLVRRARILGIVLMLMFHATNHFVLFDDIEWFPLVGVATALIFLDPDWPERLRRWLARPRIAKPNWAWLVGGAVLLPVVGAALGWRLRPSPAPNSPPPGGRLQPVAAVLIGAWVVWQAAMPLRHWAIPGDARITFEGLPFSWRLKAEVYQSLPCRIFIEDPAVIQTGAYGATTIDWRAWRGDPVIYRSVIPTALDWSWFPEIFVTFEEGLGERVFYNPMARSAGQPTPTEARARLFRFWREHYGREPRALHTTASLGRVLDATALAIRQRTGQSVTHEQALAFLQNPGPGQDKSQIQRVLQRLHPFALQGAPEPQADFFLIDDVYLSHDAGSQGSRLDHAAWREGALTEPPRGGKIRSVGRDTLFIYTGPVGLEARRLFPAASVFMSELYPDRPPRIGWNYIRELSNSKGMHISTFPLLLQRYCKRVAAEWEHHWGRRAAVKASTGVALNGRPHQPVVDPQANLAGVKVAWMRHNDWIKGLETARIPERTAMQRGGSAAPIVAGVTHPGAVLGPD